MDVRMARWDLVDARGLTRPVLRLLRGGVPLSDPGVQDCFTTPLAATEAAQRLLGTGGDWPAAAAAAFRGAPEGQLRVGEGTPVRILGPAQLDGGEVAWLASSPPGSLSAATGAMPPVDLDLPAPPRHDGAPLSGNTQTWALLDAAGAAAGESSAPSPALAPLIADDEPLSGRETRTWELIDLVGEAAGKGKPS